jgi:RNase H-fold protein (predicted Holliday junction resolvase)
LFYRSRTKNAHTIKNIEEEKPIIEIRTPLKVSLIPNMFAKYDGFFRVIIIGIPLNPKKKKELESNRMKPVLSSCIY